MKSRKKMSSEKEKAIPQTFSVYPKTLKTIDSIVSIRQKEYPAYKRGDWIRDAVIRDLEELKQEKKDKK